MGCMQQSQRFRIPSLGFRWERKYHVVFVPKCRRKTLYGQIRREWGGIFRELARQRESEIIEGHSVLEHVHMLISVPPKYAVAQVMGYFKGKSAIHIARVYAGRGRNFVDGRQERGGCASLHPGAGERREDKRLEQMELTAL